MSIEPDSYLLSNLVANLFWCGLGFVVGYRVERRRYQRFKRMLASRVYAKLEERMGRSSEP